MFDVWRGSRRAAAVGVAQREQKREVGDRTEEERPNRRRLSNMHRLCQFKPNTLHCVVGEERERRAKPNPQMGEDTIPRAYNCLATATAAIKAATKEMEADKPEAAPRTEVEPAVPVIEVMPVEAIDVEAPDD